MAQVVFSLTQKEVEAGLTEPLQDRRYFDRKYGRGGWRPQPRHAIMQAGDYRPIDDGRRSHTNAHSYLREALVCVPGEIIIVIVRAMVAALTLLCGIVPAWFVPMMFVEDWWKGFRQIFPTEEDMAVAITAVQEPTTAEWLYAQLRGVPFGLGTAVNQFGRPAALLTAAARRLLYLILGHYADDTGAVDSGRQSRMAKRDFEEMAEIMGIRLSTKTPMRAATMADFLGHAHDMSRVRTDEHCLWSQVGHARALAPGLTRNQREREGSL